MTLYPVAASRLHRRPVALPGGEMPCASLFPFFDREGRVRHVMIVSLEPPEVRVVAWRAKLFRAPFCRPLRVTSDFHQLPRLESGAIEELSGFWHFDPWWVLDHPWFRDLPGRCALEATNCVAVLPKEIKELWFARDLSRVCRVRRCRVARQITLTDFAHWKPRLLPGVSPFVPGGRASRLDPRRWELSPLWTRQNQTRD